MMIYQDSLYTNAATRLGSECDPARQGYISRGITNPRVLRDARKYSGLAAKIVEIIPNAAISTPYDIIGVDDPDDVTRLRGEVDKLLCEYGKAWMDARLYGWAVIIPVFGEESLTDLRDSDTISPDAPISRYVTYAGGLSEEIAVHQYINDTASFDYLDPVNLIVSSYTIPYTRCILIEGGSPDGDRRNSSSFYTGDMLGVSVLSRCLPSVLAWECLTGTLHTMLQRAAIDFLKIKDLENLLLDPNSFDTWIVNLKKSLSVTGILPLDSEGEYGTVTRSYKDLDKVSLILKEAIAANAGIPLPVLFDTNPQGAGKSGNFESDQWYQRIAVERRNHIDPLVTRLLPNLCASLNIPAEGVSVKWSDAAGLDTTELTNSRLVADTAKTLLECISMTSDEGVSKKLKDLLLSL